VSRSNVTAVDTSLTERPSKKLGFQSIMENWHGRMHQIKDFNNVKLQSIML